MKPIWTKCKWKKNDLQDKRVSFSLISGSIETHGIGRFVIVGPNKKGRLFVMIEVILSGKHPKELIQVRYHLSQEYVNRIRNHSDPNVAEFFV
jgi:hypothetical protein